MEWKAIQNDICIELLQCQNQTCLLKHPRALSGICIGFLKGLCQQQEMCGLNHFTLKKIEDELQKLPINGIYLYNLCQKKCNSQLNCKYLHPPWLNFICFECIDNKCDKKNVGLWHYSKLSDIKQKVYANYNINKQNPEKFCDDCETNCQCDAKIYNFDQYCIKYFKGICEFHRCIKPHKYWEELKEMGNFQNLENLVIKPCIREDQTKKIFVSQPQTLQCSFVIQKSQLSQVIKQIEKRPQVDIIFILDCTLSMECWIEAARRNIKKIITEFQKKIEIKTAVRMAAVCYQDYTEENNQNHIKKKNFTVNPEEIEKFISTIKPEGGGDIPEDLQGALEVAYKLNICKDPDSLLQLFIITDAPCHGRKYHRLSYDQRMDAEDLEEKLQKFVDLKQRFFLSFLQIKEQTAIMEQIIQKVVKNYQSARIDDQQFSDYVLFSLSSTYNKSKSMKENKQYIHVCQAEFQKQQHMPYIYNNRVNEKYLDSIKQQISVKKKKSETLLFIEKKELKVDQKGQSVTVFKGFDQKNNVYIIIKIPQDIIKKFDEKTLSDYDIQEANQFAEQKYIQQLIAQQMSQHFNYCCNRIGQSFIPLYYATPFLYKLSQSFMGLKIIYGETLINIDPNWKWKKYSSNLDQCDFDYDITAFSHFTYQFTNQQLIVTDLQGKQNLLSDPAIHIMDSSITDKANGKEQGQIQFFLNQHYECSSLCKQLKLDIVEIQKTQKIKDDNKNFEIASQKTVEFGGLIDRENLYKICQNCNVIEKLEQKSQYDEEFCQDCEQKLKNVSEQTCICCGAIFRYPAEFQQVFATEVQYCSNCQNKQCHQIVEKYCYYCNKRICLQIIKQEKINQMTYDFCNDGYFYLKQIKCKICNKKYNFNMLLSHEDYNNNNYDCGCTKKNQQYQLN